MKSFSKSLFEFVPASWMALVGHTLSAARQSGGVPESVQKFFGDSITGSLAGIRAIRVNYLLNVLRACESMTGHSVLAGASAQSVIIEVSSTDVLMLLADLDMIFARHSDDPAKWSDVWTDVFTSVCSLPSVSPVKVRTELNNIKVKIIEKYSLDADAVTESETPETKSDKLVVVALDTSIKKESVDVGDEANCGGVVRSDSSTSWEAGSTRTPTTFSFEYLNTASDDGMQKEHKVLGNSLDAAALGDYKPTLQFMDCFTRNATAAILSLFHLDRGTANVMVDVKASATGKASHTPPIAFWVTGDIELHFLGEVTTSASVGNHSSFCAFGVDFYISGSQYKSVSGPAFYPAWFVPVVDEKDATFVFKKKTIYINWPDNVSLPSGLHNSEPTIGATVCIEHKPCDDIHTGVKVDVRDDNGDAGKDGKDDGNTGTKDADMEQEDAKDVGTKSKDTKDTQPVVYWAASIFYLVPKPEFVGKTNVKITRALHSDEVCKNNKRAATDSTIGNVVLIYVLVLGPGMAAWPLPPRPLPGPVCTGPGPGHVAATSTPSNREIKHRAKNPCQSCAGDRRRQHHRLQSSAGTCS